VVVNPGQVRFDRPPVRAVTLGIWFEQISTLRTLDLHSLRTAWLSDFPVVEELAPLVPWVETEPHALAIPSYGSWPMPTCLFSNDLRDRQVLIHQDRFVLMWKFRHDHHPYPAYPGFDTLFRELDSYLQSFQGALDAAGHGKLSVSRVSLEYTNVLTFVDAEQAALAILSGSPLQPSDGIRSRDTVSLRKHYCPRDEKRVSLLLTAGEADNQADTQEGFPATELEISADAQVEPGESFMQVLEQAHEVTTEQFVSIIGDELLSRWGRQDG
jgi:uncharacterized protein (TIGR04255 family)